MSSPMSTREPRYRTPSPMTQKKGVCKICKQLRYYLVVAAALLMLMWVQPEIRLPGGIDYNVLIGDLFLWAFLALFAYKLWDYRRSLKKSDHDADTDDANWRPPTPEEFKAHRERIKRKSRES